MLSAYAWCGSGADTAVRGGGGLGWYSCLRGLCEGVGRWSNRDRVGKAFRSSASGDGPNSSSACAACGIRIERGPRAVSASNVMDLTGFILSGEAESRRHQHPHHHGFDARLLTIGRRICSATYAFTERGSLADKSKREQQPRKEKDKRLQSEIRGERGVGERGVSNRDGADGR